MGWGSGPSRPRRAGRSGADDDGGFEQLARGRDRSSGGAADPGDGEVTYTRTSAASVSAPAARSGPSLKARAVGFLSRREYARTELARKLKPHAEGEDELNKVLDDLEREGWLSTERYAQSLVHRRAERQGAARIVQELRAKGVTEAQVTELQQNLRATEYERARAVWDKRFGERPSDRAAYAKQARFLAGRGFAHDVIRRILGDSGDDE